MKNNFTPIGYIKNRIVSCVILLFLSSVSVFTADAQTGTPLRRPISPQQPMWLIHIDTWNYADPQKIINLVPEDIRPYVVMNISLSISHDEATSRFKVAEYGYEIARSWLRVCAENQMWAMIQPSSGGFSQFSDIDLSIYEEFYQNYPNLIGFNYCEQFWGFDNPTDPLSAKWTNRIAHFANLMKLGHRYGGYLVVSWCGNEWSPSINPIGMLKRNPGFAAACRHYTENFILCEKYTQQAYQSDMESICLGAYLSGYSGNYGIRYDDTGWTDINGNHENFTMATAGAPHLEHIMLTGQTVIDAPELIWTQCFRETNRMTTTDGYTKRNWETFPQFNNVSVDIFRKILDGTVRIPSRKEVIDRTKVVIINDVNTGTADQIYSSPETMFEGLYRMDGDGNLKNNKTFFKKTGRYPTIPTVYNLGDADAQTFQIQVNSSAYSGRWPNISGKVDEFNSLFPKEYTGDLFAGRHENGWVTYNPYKTGQTATATIPFKYNTSDSMELTYSQYTAGVVKEYSDKLTFYLSNYDNVLNTSLKTDLIKIYGSSLEPTFTYTDRGNHQASVITSNWSGGVFTLTIQHNGSVDISVNCSGTATDRLTSYTVATITEPAKPALYTGPRQYEAECFDYKNITGIVTGGYSDNIRNYTGQGYMRFGTNASAAFRDTINALRSGKYQLNIRYSASGGNVNSVDLYVNGVKVVTPSFTKTATESNWNINTQMIELNAGSNEIMLKASITGTYNINFDNIVISQGSSNGVYNFENDIATTNATTPAAELVTVKSGTAGVVSYTDANGYTSNCIKSYSGGTINGTGIADLDMFPQSATDYYVVWKEYYGTTGGKKGILLRGTGSNGSCPYAEGMKQGYLFSTLNNSDSTVTLLSYVATTSGLTPQPVYTSSFKISPNQPCWYRALAFGKTLKFECSEDSITWEGGSSATFSDSAYTSGSTELVWGLNTGNFDWKMDNIACLSKNVSVSKYAISLPSYALGSGPSAAQSFTVSGNSLTDNITVNSPDNFEISLSSGAGYTSSLSLTQNSGTVSPTIIYVRLKSGLQINTYTGDISVSSDGTLNQSIGLSGMVVPQSVVKQYTFSNDVATTSATTPPALKTAIGLGNSATAGVVSYTDTKGITSNMFRPYSGGNRNATGIVNLNLFSRKATDYSVTWKQCVGSAGTEYKVGVLLRGDTAKIGDASTGYVQGIMQGYLFIVYTTAGASPHSEFRTYKSTSTYNSLSMMSNTTVSTLVPAAGQPVWYRASVSGNSPVSLKFEYSTDSITWNTGTISTDNISAFTSGATQIVWGLGVSNVNFYMDNIAFYGVESNTGSTADVTVWLSSMGGFGYNLDLGPSASQSFNVSGCALTDNIVVNAPENYEISLSSASGYASSVTLTPNGNAVSETTIYVRLKSGLIVGTFTGDISITSEGAASKTISLSGAVEPSTGVKFPLATPATLVSREYYTVTGKRVYNLEELTGIVIVRNLMSDGTITISKIFISKK
jgi:hypothetical protein